MKLTDEQEKSIAAEQWRCVCDPKLTVYRNRGVFQVMVEAAHEEHCEYSKRQPRAAPSKETP
jgi:hypothetical protein